MIQARMHNYTCAQSEYQKVSHSIGSREVKWGVSVVSSFVESVVWKKYAGDVVGQTKLVERFVCGEWEVGEIPGLERR
jgi:hypothetical protein